jgi:tetratricopeptide (TPR) repeat protein
MLKGLFKFIIFMGGCLFLLILGLYWGEIKTRLQQYHALNDIQSAFQKNHPKEAKALLEAAVQRFPQEPIFHLKLAHYLHQTKQWHAAKTQYEAGLTQNPTAYEYQYNYARLLIQLRNVNGAIEIYRTILNQNPHHIGALVDLAGVYRFAGNRADALGFREERLPLWNWSRYYYSLALSQNPEIVRAWYGLAEVLQRDGQFKAASAGYCQVIHRMPNYPLAWFNLGLSQWYEGHEENGLKLMNWAVQSDAASPYQGLASEFNTIHALRQTYFLVHKKPLPMTHFPDAWIDKLNAPHPTPPFVDADFPEPLLDACHGWVQPELKVDRPTLTALSSTRLSLALEAKYTPLLEGGKKPVGQGDQESSFNLPL